MLLERISVLQVDLAEPELSKDFGLKAVSLHVQYACQRTATSCSLTEPLLNRLASF